MRISQLITKLKEEQERIGDVEVTMQATVLSDGYSCINSKTLPDVFESTVSTVMKQEGGKLGKRLRLFWQH